jgi:plasmid rolling circle replication initiator protein Rep
MNPKEKAERLVNQYKIILMNEDTECGNEILCTSIAIKNVLVMIEEIQEVLMTDELYNPGNLSFERIDDFWEEVKKEVQKL